jgi:archaellum component FlaG (FlaF/FlaG flagellin family)
MRSGIERGVVLKISTIGRRIGRSGLVAILCLSVLAGSVLGYYVWKTVNMPFEVTEPLEVLNYQPSKLSLYPGEGLNLSITIQNHASINYTVVMSFALDNTTYQNSYVNFSNTEYAVLPGQNNLTASLSVTSEAPPISTMLTISLVRLSESDNGSFTRFEKLQFTSSYVTVSTVGNFTYDTIFLGLKNTGTSTASFDPSMIQLNGMPISASANVTYSFDNPTSIDPGKTVNGYIILTTGTTWPSGMNVEVTIVTAAGNHYPQVVVLP